MMKKSNQEETRQHNSRLVLNTIYQAGEISRVEIARHTHLTRTTVSDIVATFIDSGLVIETGQAPSRGGKPATLLQIDANSHLMVGVDLAEKEFCGALVNLRGAIVARICQPVPTMAGEPAVQRVYALVEALLERAQQPVIGIGVGVPGLIDPGSGTVRQAVNLDWQELALGDLLHTRFERPVYLANDCQVAALGEYTFGTPPATSNLILIRAGQGVGSGIVIDGQLFYGDRAGAGEIGHIQIQPGGEHCRCGNNGCLETIASVRALLRKSPPSIQDFEGLRQAAQARDPEVLNLINAAAEALGGTINQIASVLNIQDIRIAGGLAQLGGIVFEPIRERMAGGMLPALATHTRVGPASLGDELVILGAASLVLKNELGFV